jgi:hypothetical protein
LTGVVCILLLLLEVCEQRSERVAPAAAAAAAAEKVTAAAAAARWDQRKSEEGIGEKRSEEPSFHHGTCTRLTRGVVISGVQSDKDFVATEGQYALCAKKIGKNCKWMICGDTKFAMLYTPSHDGRPTLLGAKP